jgi:hypothetical protein
MNEKGAWWFDKEKRWTSLVGLAAFVEKEISA